MVERATSAVSSEPDQARALALLRRLEWGVRHASDSVLGGRYRSAFRGRGMEFDQVVKYAFGDDVRDIDWNVTARLGEPYRKKFVEEREVTLVLVFEDTPSLQFGSGARTKREVLRETAGLLALLAAASQDRLAVAYAAPGRSWYGEAVRGRSRIVRQSARLLGETPPAPDAGGAAAVDWRFLHTALPRHAVLVWLGDFAPAPAPDGWARLRQKCVTLGVRVDDPWERRLPDHVTLTAYDPLDGRLVPLVTGSPQQRRAHAEWVARRELGWENLFPRALDRLVVGTEEEPLHRLVEFFQKRMAAA